MIQHILAKISHRGVKWQGSDVQCSKCWDWKG